MFKGNIRALLVVCTVWLSADYAYAKAYKIEATCSGGVVQSGNGVVVDNWIEPGLFLITSTHVLLTDEALCHTLDVREIGCPGSSTLLHAFQKGTAVQIWGELDIAAIRIAPELAGKFSPPSRIGWGYDKQIPGTVEVIGTSGLAPCAGGPVTVLKGGALNIGNGIVKVKTLKESYVRQIQSSTRRAANVEALASQDFGPLADDTRLLLYHGHPASGSSGSPVYVSSAAGPAVIGIHAGGWVNFPNSWAVLFPEQKQMATRRELLLGAKLVGEAARVANLQHAVNGGSLSDEEYHRRIRHMCLYDGWLSACHDFRADIVARCDSGLQQALKSVATQWVLPSCEKEARRFLDEEITVLEALRDCCNIEGRKVSAILRSVEASTENAFEKFCDMKDQSTRQKCIDLGIRLVQWTYMLTGRWSGPSFPHDPQDAWIPSDKCVPTPPPPCPENPALPCPKAGPPLPCPK